MKRPNNSEITRETLYNPEISMPYWMEFSSGEFIRQIVHDLRHELHAISTLASFIHDNPEAGITPVNSLNGEKTIREVCDMILLKETKFSEIPDVAWRYAENTEPQDSR